MFLKTKLKDILTIYYISNNWHFVLVNGCICVDNEIKLKQLELEELNNVFSLTEKNKETLIPWFEWMEDISLEKTKEFLIKSNKKNEKGKGCDLGIYYNGDLAGVIGITNFNAPSFRDVELSYWLSSDFTGKGIMIRSLRKVEEFCFVKARFVKVYIMALPENMASRHIIEKLGFEVENVASNPTVIGTRRSYYIYYSKTLAEYKSNFWNHLNYLLTHSKIIIDTKKGFYDDYLGIVTPVDFGRLSNDWDEEDQIDIFIGSDNTERETPEFIICTLDLENKFTDIKILYKCTQFERDNIFSLLNEKNGILLIESPI